MKSICIFVGMLMIMGALADASIAQNYKIRQAVSMNGQKGESIVYVKGLRKRTEGGVVFAGMGGDVADVVQCDLKRNLKISDKKKMYAIDPFEDDSDPAPKPVRTAPVPRSTPAPTVKGGIVTYVSNVTDTLERKQMFGLTARHIKSSMSMEASPDACMKADMKVETDGWYVDLPEFSCPLTSRPSVPTRPSPSAGGGCRDQIKFRTSGGGKLGFALTETRTMMMGDEGVRISQSTETIEFSKATLDSALFDIPAGYALTENSQDLYGRPDIAAIMKGMGRENGEETTVITKTKPGGNTNPAGTGAKRPGMIRIGVYAPTNNGGENVSAKNLQAFLVQKLTTGNVEAVAIASEDDAKNSDCDYLLTSGFSKLKQSTSSRIGGMLGKVTNTDTSASRSYEAQVDFLLVSRKDGKTVSKNKANFKGEADVDRAAENALSQEAAMVLSVAR